MKEQIKSSWINTPLSTTTDAEWQAYFELLKASIQPEEQRRMSKSGNNDYYYSSVDSNTDKDASHSYYCLFINDILESIRGTSRAEAQHDYCYYIYQIAELLKYEHDRLRSKWLPEDGCFEVWLEF